MRVRRIGFAVAVAALGCGGVAQAEDWNWSITPYLWATDITVDASVNDRTVIDSEIAFGDVLDDLDFAIMAHVEGQRGRHGLLLDLFLADLGDEDRVFDLGGPGQVIAKTDLETTMLDAGGIFNPRGDGTGVALLYGVRLIDIDQEIDARFQLNDGSTPSRRFETSKTLTDALLGVRYLTPFGARGLFHIRADVSTGGSEMTWNAWSGVGWTFGTRGQNALLLGYRHMQIEFDEADRSANVEAEVGFSGLFTGVKFGIGNG